MAQETYTNRQIPFSLEAEQSFLGSILYDPKRLDEVSSLIKKDDFYMAEHADIYQAMCDLSYSNKTVDGVMLLDELEKATKYEREQMKDYLSTLHSCVATAANIMDYAKIVHDKSLLRRLLAVCDEIVDDVQNSGEDALSLIDSAEAKIYAISRDNDNRTFVPIKQALMDTYDHLEKLATNREETMGISSGFADLDQVLVGMGKSDLILVGARPGMGKTSFAMNVATQVALKHKKKAVCIFSLEMSAQQLVTRVLSSEAQVESKSLRTGILSNDEWTRITMTTDRLSETNILIDDTPGITVTGMKSKLRRVHDEIALVVIDYLGLMQSDHRHENRVQEVAEISRGLKLLAKEMKVPVIACAQLSRGTEGRTDKRPMLSDLRDSGSIEQDADVVMFLYRDEYYKDDPQNQNIAEVIVAKNRHGALGTVKMSWLGAFTKFSSLSDLEAPTP